MQAALAAAPSASGGFRPPGGAGGGFRLPVGAGGSFKPPAGATAGGGGGGFKRPGGLGAGGGGAAAAAGGGGSSEPPKAYMLHDPTAEGAVVLNSVQWAGSKGQLAPGRPVSPVVVDPYIARHLRPHQVGRVGRRGRLRRWDE